MPSTANIHEVKPVALVIIGSAVRYKEYSQMKPADLKEMKTEKDMERSNEKQKVRESEREEGKDEEKKSDMK